MSLVIGVAVACRNRCGIRLWVASLGPAPLGENLSYSTLVVDREGRLLRPYTTHEGPLAAAGDARRASIRASSPCCWPTRTSASPAITASICWRSAAPHRNSLTSGRIVSGASTLTMQVARLLEPRAERSFTAKLRQMVRAVEIERQLSKDEILALYFSLAPYGGNLEGIRAASLAYFGKEPRRLTLGRGSAAGRAAAIARAAPARPFGRSARATPAIACSIASPPPARCRWTRSSAPSTSRCRRAASRCRRWRRIRPMPWWPPRRRGASIASPSMRRCRRRWRNSPAIAPARSVPTCRSRSSRSITAAARSWRASPRPTISTAAAPVRST